jgi:hypothetical protein
MAQFTAGEVLTAANLNDAINGPTINAQTGTAYTLAATDTGKLVTLSNASAITVTINPESSTAFTAGAAVALAQLDVGQVSITGGSGVTINGGSALAAQYSAAQLYYLDNDTWLAVGDFA